MLLLNQWLKTLSSHWETSRFSLSRRAHGCGRRSLGRRERLGSRRIQVELLEDRVLPSTVVTTALDVVDNADGLTSLREAVTFANSNADVSAITFADGSAITGGTNFSDATPDTILLSGGQMTITESTTITGSGANRLTIDAAQGSRIFEVARGRTVTIAGLTLTNGLSDGGGAILNFGTLTVTECWIHSNMARNGSGASANGNGGGLKSLGSLTLIGSTVSGNSADENGGGINLGDGGLAAGAARFTS